MTLPGLPNPWIILAAILVIGGAYAYGDHTGAKNKENEMLAQQAKEADIIQKVSDAAQASAASAIATIKVNNVTTKQILEKQIVTVPDYSRCSNSDDGLRAINDALTNSTPGKSADPSGVPGSHPSHR